MPKGYKLTEKQREQIIVRSLAGEKNEALAAEFGIDQSYITVLKTRAWKKRDFDAKLNAFLSFGS